MKQLMEITKTEIEWAIEANISDACLPDSQPV